MTQNPAAPPGALVGAGYPLWHPMTDMHAYLADPITIVGGEGATVWDDQGNEYIGATSGLWNTACGFRHPDVVAAIHAQLDRLPYGTLFRFGNEPAARYAKRLADHLDEHLTRVFYASSGASAVETAVKVVRRCHALRGQPQRRIIVAMSHGYHGTSMGAMALTGEDLGQDDYAVDRRDVRHIRTPDPYRCPGPDDEPAGARACLADLRALVEREGEHIAAVLFEPILGSGGVIEPPQEWFDGVSEICREHGLLMIVDEVATGFGRTGKMFAYEHFGLRPDAVVLAKGINSGYVPMSATVFSEEIFETYWRNGAVLAHGETQAGNPLACAAALATLDVLEREDLLGNAQRVGARLRESLEGLYRHPHVGDIRGRGLMIGIELVRDQSTKEPVGFPDVAALIRLIAREGLIVHPAPSGMSLFPPLVLSEREADRVAAILDRLLASFSVR